MAGGLSQASRRHPWHKAGVASREREEDERGFLSLDLVGPLWLIRSLLIFFFFLKKGEIPVLSLLN